MKKSIILVLTALSVITSSAMTSMPVNGNNGYVTACADGETAPVSGELKTEYGIICYTIENGEVKIDNYYFDKSDIPEVTLPTEIEGYPVTTVAKDAFFNETNVTGIILPESIKRVEDYAFSSDSSSSLRWVRVENAELEIPQDSRPFSGDITLYGKKDSTAELYSYRENLSFIDYETKVKYGDITGEIVNGEIAIISCDKEAAEVTIPEEINGIPVTSINYLAFGGCQDLKSVYIPDSVKSIGGSAFINCISLTDIRLSETITEIPAYCFSRCKVLMDITIPESVVSIGDSAFENCGYMERITIPESVTKIGSYAFRNCLCLDEVELLNHNISYGLAPFENTDFIEKFDNSDGIVVIDHCLVDGRNYKGDSFTVPCFVFEISPRAFEGNTNLTRVIIDPNVQKIGDSCFSGCTSLELAKISGAVEEIGSNCFSGCTALEWVKLPDTVKEIRDGTFDGCISLSEIFLPAKLEKIGKQAFGSCGKLEKMELPETVTEINSEAFKGCAGLKEITIPSAVTELSPYCFSGCSGLTEVTIPANITEISSNSFSGCTSLEKVTLHDNIKKIGFFAFSNCQSLKEIDIPDSVKEIEMAAFSNCKSLESIKIPEGCKLGIDVFMNCTSLAEVKLPENIDISNAMFKGTPWLDSIRKGSELIIFNNKVFDGTQCKGEVVIPEGVTEICGHAFDGSEITSVKFPDSLKTIGNYAFSNCNKFEEFTIPDGIETISGGMFCGCENLKKVNIPDSVTVIESGAFEFCTGLTEFTVPASVKSVGMAFEYADRLKTITFLNPECVIAPDGENFLTMPRSTTVRGYADSTAYRFAYGSKRNFEAISPIGDANCDNNVDISDAVLIMQSISNPSKYGEKGTEKNHITAQGKVNGDVYNKGDGITNKDALSIQKLLLKLIDKLPESEMNTTSENDK